MTDNDKIKAIVTSLRDNALGDIKRASAGESKMGAFILSSCLIDAIAGFMKGSDTNHADYKCFVCKYMSTYNKDDIYTDLRCKLVHSYSEGGSYWFTDNKRTLHLSKHTDGKTIVNLEDFIEEIESALTAYTTDLQNTGNQALRTSAIKRFDGNGIIQVMTPPAPSTGTGSTLGLPPLSGAP
ncbi:MAG: hypothetical protein PHG71_06470 [Kiritimatiellae bacterium]|nr:hypothetical protein [Kiritimatiellia bacterium]